ncbi:hypothetical protein ACJJIK_13890 [Microbulbifer sp. ZKSA006]|uniref:hypothetical protein n=1 Tax=Microbulbifer sp. ZKSA006 TaxID=3243390 RepID=UPI004039D8EC
MKKLYLNSIYVGNLEYGTTDQSFLKGRFIANKNWPAFKDDFFKIEKIHELYGTDYQKWNKQREAYWLTLDKLLIETEDKFGYKEIYNFTQFFIGRDNTFSHRRPLRSLIYAEWHTMLSTGPTFKNRIKALKLYCKYKKKLKPHLQRRSEYIQ